MDGFLAFGGLRIQDRYKFLDFKGIPFTGQDDECIRTVIGYKLDNSGRAGSFF